MMLRLAESLVAGSTLAETWSRLVAECPAVGLAPSQSSAAVVDQVETFQMVRLAFVDARSPHTKNDQRVDTRLCKHQSESAA